MLARVLTLRFDPVLEAFDDAPLQEVLKAREVFAIREHFFVRNETPYLAVVVTYGPRPTPESAVAGKRIPGRNADALRRPAVAEADLPLWNAARDWRAERAQRDGVPPYVICTNRQLAAMVERRPRSMSALGAIEGIGKAKLERYGQELLALLGRPAGEGVRPTGNSTDGSSSSGETDASAAPPPPKGTPESPAAHRDAPRELFGGADG